MAGWGVTLIVLGIGSFLLNFIGVEFVILAWVDSWGPLVGALIRIGIVVAGILMLVISAIGSKNQGPTGDQSTTSP